MTKTEKNEYLKQAKSLSRAVTRSRNIAAKAAGAANDIFKEKQGGHDGSNRFSNHGIDALVGFRQQAVTYDRYGRMNYHPELHHNQKKQWVMPDQKYLIENYERDGPTEVSLALGRTIHTVMTRAYELRKKGLMAKPLKKNYSKRRII